MRYNRVRSIAGKLLRGLGRHLPLVVLGLSITVNLLLASRLLRAERSERRSLSAGALVHGFAATSLTGAPTRIEFNVSVPTILYHFSPTCGWCERNWDNVRTLIADTRGRYRFIGVSTGPVPQSFMRERALDFDVAMNVTPDVVHQYALGGTPQTIVVSLDGRVLKNWDGVFDGRQRRDVEGYFVLGLPGLLPAAPTAHHP